MKHGQDCPMGTKNSRAISQASGIEALSLVHEVRPDIQQEVFLLEREAVLAGRQACRRDLGSSARVEYYRQHPREQKVIAS